MPKQNHEVFEGLSDISLSWVRANLRKTLARSELQQDEELRKTLLAVSEDAHNSTFVEDYDYHPGSLNLSRLKPYMRNYRDIMKVFMQELLAADLCGYVRQDARAAGLINLAA